MRVRALKMHLTLASNHQPKAERPGCHMPHCLSRRTAAQTVQQHLQLVVAWLDETTNCKPPNGAGGFPSAGAALETSTASLTFVATIPLCHTAALSADCRRCQCIALIGAQR